MAKAIFICGKICSGKTTLAREILRRRRAVLLSCDEIAAVVFHKDLGERHDAVMADVQKYLHQKARDVIAAGCDAILDWGFWKKEDRRAVREMYSRNGIEQEWHYMAVDDQQWEKNIAKRNAEVTSGLSDDYFLDEGLRAKLLANFEEPERSEMDFWHCGADDMGI